MSWNDGEVQRLFAELRVRRGDSTMVEVKKAAGGLPTKIDRSVCAFANMPDGGTIIFGVDENSGFTVTGVEEPAKLEAALVDQARKRVNPAPSIQTQTLVVDQKPIVIADISGLPLRDRPATVDGRSYLRQADGNFVMHDHELAMIEVDKILMAEQKDYDRTEAKGLTIGDLMPDIVERYIASVRENSNRLSKRSDEEILRLTGVVLSNGAPTLAGLYAMGAYPQGYHPSLTVTAAVQLPSDEGGARTRDLQDFAGPIPVLLDELMNWCSRNLLTMRAYLPDGHMREIPEVPLSAVRELISNALVHRDLSPNSLGIGKQIQVRLTSTSLFILSPGGLRGVSLQQLQSEDHAQAAVNQRLYAIAKNLTTKDGNPIIEGEGGGIREVFRAANRQGLPEPTLINTGVQFKALLWRPNAATTAQTHGATPEVSAKTSVKRSQLSKNEPVILEHLEEIGEASFRELLTALPLTEGQLRYALNRALAEGRVKMLGRQGDRDTRYRL